MPDGQIRGQRPVPFEGPMMPAADAARNVPHLRVITEPEPMEQSIDQQEAQAMINAASWLGDQASRLPVESSLRADFIQMAATYRFAARVQWPTIRPDRAIVSGIAAVS